MAESFDEELKDIVCICKDCHKQFTFTIWEQKLFGQRGWIKPVRCPVCRQRRRILKTALEDGISISDQGIHEATCAKCGVSFLSTLQIKQNENEYCPNCWKEIKGF
jgi:NAD-dependent SIR2 family protein deacetylase